MIEDQDLGLIKEKEMPDVKAVASDLVGKGYTSAQAKDMIGSLGLNMELESSLLAEMDALAPQEAPVEPSTKTSVASNPKPLPQAQNTPTPPTSVSEDSFDLGGLDDGFDLDAMATTTVMADLRTELANKEISSLASAYLDEDEAAELEGEDAVYDYAVQKMGQDIYNNALKLGEERLQAASTPEEVEAVVADTERAAKREFIPIVEFKKNWVIKKSGVEHTDLPRLDQKVIESHLIAGEIDKVNNKYWEASSILDVLGDFGELIIPVTGVVEEERVKLNNNVDSLLDKISSAKDFESKKRVAEALAEDVVNTETFLMSNNNALINMGQAQVLADAIRQGGLDRTSGNITDAEYENVVMTAVNTAFAGIEVGGFAAALKALARRVLPQSNKKLKELKTQLVQATTPLEGELLIGGQDNLLPGPTRSTGSAKHTQYSENPTQALIDASEGDIKDVWEAQGVKAEDVVINFAPTPSASTDLGFADLLDDRQNISSLVFADQKVVTAGEARALALEKATGGNIRFIPSSVGFLPDAEEVEDSLGVFRFLFGKSGSKGFDTIEEAQNAATKNVLGDTAQLVAKDGKFYIEVEQRHYFDAMKDVVGKEQKSNILLRAINPLRQLGDDFMKGVFAVKGINRNKTVKLEKRMSRALSGLKPSTANLLQKALKMGDDMMEEWNSYGSFVRGTGFASSRETLKAYRRYRDVRTLMEEVYHIRNNAFFKKKNSLGYKNVKLGKDDAGEDIFELGRPTRARDVDSDLVWDSRTGAEVRAKDLGDDVVIMKSDNPVRRGDKDYDHFIVNPEQVNNLPRQLLNKRPGHIDRMYRDTGYTIKVKKSRKVGGKDKDYTSTTHIFKNKKQANEEIAKLRESDPEGDYSVVPARENSDMDDIFNDTSSVQFSYGASHTKARKSELLKGVDGADAPLADITDRLSRAVSSAGRAYDVDIMDTMKARFYNSFDKLLARGKNTEWDNDFGRMLRNRTDVDQDVKEAAKQMHNYIRTFEQIENDKLFQLIDGGVEALTGGMFKSNVQGLNTFAQKITTNLFIVGAPLFQLPQNFVQMAYIHMRNPISGSLGVAQSVAIAGSVVAKAPNMKYVSKVLGVSEEMAKDVMDTMKASGLLDVGSADDFLSMTRKAMGSSNPSAAGVAGEWAKGVASMTPVLKPLQIAQEGTVAMVNIAAYLAEFNKLVVRGGGKYDAKMKKTISFNAQKVTNTQNNIDKFWFQNKGSFVSTMLQFAQHMTKVFLDAVVDPHIKTVSGGKLDLGKDAGPLSETWGKAVYSTAFVYSMFGLTGVMGSKGSEAIGDAIREEFPDIDDTLAETPLQGGCFNDLLNSAARSIFGGEGASDFTGRMGPGGAADYINDTFFVNAGQIDMLGPFGGALDGILDWGANTKDLLLTDVPIDGYEKFQMIAVEGLSLFKGLRDYDKARIAVAMEQWPYFAKMGSDLRVTEMEGALALMSVPPMMVQSQLNDMDFGSGGEEKDSIARINDLLIRQAKRELSGLTSEQRRDPLIVKKIIGKWQNYAYRFSGYSAKDQVADVWKQNVYNSSTDTYQGYIKPTLRDTKMVDRIDALKVLRSKATTEQAKQEIDVKIQQAEMLNLSNEEVFK